MLAVEAVEGAPHAVAGQVFADIDVEAVALEFVGDVAGVVDRLLERRFGVGIFGVADDQRKAVGASAATDGSTGATDKIEVTSNARQILMRRRSSQQGADPSLRLGDLTLRKLHYQTGVATRQPLVESGLSRQLTADVAPDFEGNKSRPQNRIAAWQAARRQCDRPHIGRP